MLVATLDQPIPLSILATDGRTNLFARVRIYESDGVLVDTLEADHVAEGLYSVSWTPDLEGFYSVVCTLYSDSGHTTEAGYDKTGETVEVGSWKLSIGRLLGLHHENSVIDQQAYDSVGRLLSARFRHYDSKANALVAGSGGLTDSYSATAVYNSQGNLTSYTMVRDT